ncbi:flagellar hook-length control protein FliK [uncultured Clostridium sp.]|uniref:flagellar hook-length control protein FliK n=1 Tax=uncultured Clostridium sp. TaxID=59620 RepID=UPI0025D022C7|nr:flagellar hook-length control protein FliK [uncultured Clostridium sp.]
MVISAQVLLDSSNSSSNLSSKNSNSLSNATANKAPEHVSSIVDNSRTNSKASIKKEDFKDALNSSMSDTSSKTDKVNNDKNNSKDGNVDNSEKDTAIKELKDKIQELKEKAEENPGDEKEVNDIIGLLLNALNTLVALNNNYDTKLQGNTESINVIVESIMDDSSKAADSSSLLNQLLELLSTEDVASILDSETMTGVKDILTQLQAKVTDYSKVSDKIKGSINDDSKVYDKMNSSINDVLSKLTEMIDESKNSGEKVLSLEDMLKNSSSYSQGQSSSYEDNSEMFSSKDTSKEDKFLNSLLDDKKDNAVDNKINIFASRTQNIQGQNAVQRGLTVNKATFTHDLIQDVKYMSTNNLKELTVKVNPGNLGEITIKLVQEDGLMKANLKANSKETTALLSQNLAEIKRELGDQNIKISEVNIELYNDDTTFFKDGSFGGALSQQQGREESRAASTSASTKEMVSQNDDEVVENNAEINTALDFLA